MFKILGLRMQYGHKRIKYHTFTLKIANIIISYFEIICFSELLTSNLTFSISMNIPLIPALQSVIQNES